jgi:mRNA-degrading endonuclease toxin of MazEF toxin-antitoxin module
MTALLPGDVVLAYFAGAQQTKVRPAVVISTELYQNSRPDVILALLTSQIPKVISPFDYLIQDWSAAGLHQPSVFRLYAATMVQQDVRPTGRLSDRDWQEIQARLKLGLAVI